MFYETLALMSAIVYYTFVVSHTIWRCMHRCSNFIAVLLCYWIFMMRIMVTMYLYNLLYEALGARAYTVLVWAFYRHNCTRSPVNKLTPIIIVRRIFKRPRFKQSLHATGHNPHTNTLIHIIYMYVYIYIHRHRRPKIINNK